MDAAYLQREVGPALAKGLAAVTAAQPYDPIDYLGQWMLQYVLNQAKDKQRAQDAIQLEAEKKQHAEALEWERLRLEQEEQSRKEALLVAEKAQQQAQLRMIHDFEVQVAQKEAAADQGISEITKPLTKLQGRLQVIVGELESHSTSALEIFKARNIAQDDPVAKLLKGILLLIGWCRLPDLVDWNECKKHLRSADLLPEIFKFSSLKRQTVHKFDAAIQLIKDFPVADTKRTSYTTFLLWEWLTTCVNIRKAALILRSERLGVPMINDPDAEDEEEDLEEELRYSETAISKEEDETQDEEAEGEGDDEEEEDEED